MRHIQDHPKIQDGTLCDRSQRLLAVKLCHKELHPNSSVNPRYPSGVTDDYLAIIELLKPLIKCYLGSPQLCKSLLEIIKRNVVQLRNVALSKQLAKSENKSNPAISHCR